MGFLIFSSSSSRWMLGLFLCCSLSTIIVCAASPLASELFVDQCGAHLTLSLSPARKPNVTARPELTRLERLHHHTTFMMKNDRGDENDVTTTLRVECPDGMRKIRQEKIGHNLCPRVAFRIATTDRRRLLTCNRSHRDPYRSKRSIPITVDWIPIDCATCPFFGRKKPLCLLEFSVQEKCRFFLSKRQPSPSSGPLHDQVAENLAILALRVCKGYVTLVTSHCIRRSIKRSAAVLLSVLLVLLLHTFTYQEVSSFTSLSRDCLLKRNSVSQRAHPSNPILTCVISDGDDRWR